MNFNFTVANWSQEYRRYSLSLNSTFFVFFLFVCFVLFLLFRAVPAAYGGSHAGVELEL